jgi:hypothetical protein
MKAKRK